MERRLDPELPPITLATLANLVREWNGRGLAQNSLQDALYRSWHFKPGTLDRAPLQDRFLGDLIWENPALAKAMMLWQDILGRQPQDLYGLGLDELQQRNR